MHLSLSLTIEKAYPTETNYSIPPGSEPPSLCLSNASIFQLSSKFQLDYFHHCTKKLCYLSSLRPSHDPTSISSLPIKIKLLEKAIHRTFLPPLAFIFKPLQSSSALSILTPGAMKLLSSVSISSCQTQDDPAAFTWLQLSVAAQLTLFLKRYFPLVSVNPLFSSHLPVVFFSHFDWLLEALPSSVLGLLSLCILWSKVTWPMPGLEDGRCPVNARNSPVHSSVDSWAPDAETRRSPQTSFSCNPVLVTDTTV